MGDKFSPFIVRQKLGHCGPCSLSACLFMLGIDATQRELASAAGKPWRVFVDGLDAGELGKAACKNGAVPETVLRRDRRQGQAFARRLSEHLAGRGPAVLLVDDFEHWVAVVGHQAERGKFIVYDPIADDLFLRWSERELLANAWNEDDDEDDDEPDQYCAILLRRRDGRPPVWRVTEPWMRIHRRGADVTAGTIANDLSELVANADRRGRRAFRAGECRDGVPLARVLRNCRNAVLDAILNWGEGDGGCDRHDLARLYDDYAVCAEAADIVFPADADCTALAIGLTAVFSAYWWGAEMDGE